MAENCVADLIPLSHDVVRHKTGWRQGIETYNHFYFYDDFLFDTDGYMACSLRWPRLPFLRRATAVEGRGIPLPLLISRAEPRGLRDRTITLPVRCSLPARAGRSVLAPT